MKEAYILTIVCRPLILYVESWLVGYYDQMMVTAKAYLQEAKWLNEDYVATFEEYKENGVYSASYLAMLTVTFLGMVDEGTLDVFEWLSTFPPLLVTCALIGRLCGDIASYEVNKHDELRQ